MYIRLKMIVWAGIMINILPISSYAEDWDIPNKNTPAPTACRATPMLPPDNIPLGAFHSSNNLRRLTGAAEVAKGHYMLLKGKVVDQFCVPVTNALVKIWQADAAGYYQEEYADGNAVMHQKSQHDPYFSYTGTAYTNNLGEFTVISIFPGMRSEQAPHLNMAISHPQFQEIETMMFFTNHPQNATDPDLTDLPEEERGLLMASSAPVDGTGRYEGRVYDFVITLEGQNAYRQF